MQATSHPHHVVVDAKAIVIKEYFGNVASSNPQLSACEVIISEPSEEAWQAPEFDEYVLVLEGVVQLKHSDGSIVTVRAGEAAFLAKGLRVKWIWPGPARYIPICLPAFTPENCGREDEAGNHMAKSSAAMDKLRALHANNGSTAAAGGGSGSAGGLSVASVAIGIAIGVAGTLAFLKHHK